MKVPLAVVLLVAVVGCSTRGPSPAGVSTPAPSQAGQPSTTKDPRSLAPVGRVMPLDAYRPDREQQIVLGKAQQILIDQCMRDAGFDPQRPPPSPPPGYEEPKSPDPVSAVVDPDHGYGIPHDSATLRYWQAERRYEVWMQQHPPSAAYLRVLNGVDKPGHGPDTGCIGRVQRAMSDGQDLSAAERFSAFIKPILAKVWEQTHTDPRVVSAMSDWSSCMHKRGFDFASTFAISQDPVVGNPRAHDREVQIAHADVSCEWSTRLVDVWDTVMEQYQSQAIDDNAQVLGSFKNAQAEEIRVAEQVLAHNPGA